MADSITILKQPANVCLARSPLLYQVECTNMYQNTGAFRAGTLQITGFNTPGEVITFQFSDKTIEFTCATTPDNSGLQFKPSDSSLSVYTTYLLGILDRNSDMNKLFSFTINGTSIEYIAKEKGTYENFTFSTDASITHTIDVSGVNILLNENFSIAATIFIEETLNSGIFTRLNTRWLIPNAEKKAEISVEEDVLPFFGEDLPGYSISSPQICNSIVKQFVVRFNEYYGEPPSHQLMFGHQLIKQAIKGGILKSHYENKLNLLNTGGEFQINQKFLTWFPNNRLVPADMLHYLYYWFYDNHTISYTIRAKVYYTDGTNSGNVTLFTGSYTENLLLAIPSGFNRLGLQNVNPSKVPTRYEIWVINQTSAIISEIKSFKLDEKWYNERHILFENSFGAFETIRIKGNFAITLENEQEVIRKVLSTDFSDSDGESKVRTSWWQQKFSGSTGAIDSKEELEVYKSFVASRSFYLDTGSGYLSIVCLFDEVEFEEDDSYLFGFPFEFKLSNRETGYSQ